MSFLPPGAAYSCEWDKQNPLQFNLYEADILLSAAWSRHAEVELALAATRRYWSEQCIFLREHMLTQPATSPPVERKGSDVSLALDFVAFDDATDLDRQLNALAQVGYSLTQTMLEGRKNYGVLGRQLWPCLSLRELCLVAAEDFRAAYSAEAIKGTAYDPKLTLKIQRLKREETKKLQDAATRLSKTTEPPSAEQYKAAWAIKLRTAIAGEQLKRDKKRQKDHPEEFEAERGYLREKVKILAPAGPNPNLTRAPAEAVHALAHTVFEPRKRVARLRFDLLG